MNRLRDLSVYVEMLRNALARIGIIDVPTLRVSRAWLESGVGAGDAAHWIRIGLRPDEAHGFAGRGIDPITVAVDTVQIGDDDYERHLGRIRQDEQLLADMWRDAEHLLDEHPGKRWTVVSVGGMPVAWAAATVVDADGHLLRCSDNYERRGIGRVAHLYRLAYRRRHETIVAPAGLPALTYLFAEPIPLHEADGWVRTGLTGTSDLGHQWWELRRAATGG
jgi:hypothetical protein